MITFCCITTDTERGRLAPEWTELYARGRTDAEYARLTGDSRQNISGHRRVFAAFGNDNVANQLATWTHCLNALEECDSPDVAREWLTYRGAA